MVDFLQLKYDEIVNQVGTGKLVLDAGCGSGSPTWAIAQGGNTVTGLDISISELRKAKEKHPEILFVAGTAGYLPFRSCHFDVVACIELIEHLENPAAFLEEAKKVLKANGKLLLTCPNIASFRSRVTFLLKGYFPDERVPEHIQHFTANMLRKYLEETEFVRIHIYSIGFFAAYRILPRRLGVFFFGVLCRVFKKLGFGQTGAGIFAVAIKSSQSSNHSRCP